MGGAQAANTLVDIKIRQLERTGKKLTEKEKTDLFEKTKATYDNQTDPRYGAARLWLDDIIMPHQTRDILIRSLGIVCNNPDIGRFNAGVIQT